MSSSAHPSAAELPIACTLGPDDGATRIRRWTALLEQDTPQVERHERELIVRFAARVGVREELDALAAAESRCCSFAEWHIARAGDHVVLRIASDSAGLDAIAGLFQTR